MTDQNNSAQAATHVETLERMRADYNPDHGPMSTLKAAALDAALSKLRAEGVQVPPKRHSDDPMPAEYEDDPKAVCAYLDGWNNCRAEMLASAPVADTLPLEKALSGLLDYVDRNTCTHENRHKAGTLWTICDDCGRKWASDRNPYTPHQDAPAVAAARAALASAPVYRVLKTDSDHAAAIARLSELMDMDPAPDSDADGEMQLLALLIQSYEKEKFPFPVAINQPLAWIRADLIVDGKLRATTCSVHASPRPGYIPLRLSEASAPVAGEALGWRVRERRSNDGTLLDCFVEAPAAPGMAYAQEVLGDDYAEAQGGIEGKLKHCLMIVAWANAPVAREAQKPYA